MTLYQNNLNKGESFRDGNGRIWVRNSSLDLSTGKRFAYVLDAEASAAGIADVERRRAERVAVLSAEVVRLGGQPLTDDVNVLRRQIGRLQVAVAARRVARLGYIHTFTSESGSMYFELVIGDKLNRIRISDHELPMHEERIYNHSVGRKCSNREIVFQS